MDPRPPELQRALPRDRRPVWPVLGIAVLALALVGADSWWRPSNSDQGYPPRPLQPESEPEPMVLPPPPIDDEYFPCSDCHEDELADPERRELDEHAYIELAHGDLWCLDCHDSDQRDLLHLSDASPVRMEESWRLCTRCHAKRIPDWRAGVHGKRTGSWWGPKEYRTCVACHDPHSPLFKPLEPKPPPVAAGDARALHRAGPEEVRHAEE
jgi:hypothetical protein